MDVRNRVASTRNKQIISALVSGLILSLVYLLIVLNYCVTVIDPISPDPNGYYEQIAKFPKILAFTIFVVSAAIFSIVIEKKHKTFATTFFLVILLIGLLSLYLVKTKVSMGI